MFRKRKNSRKPFESFYDTFKNAYPEAHIARSSTPTISRRTSFAHSLTDDLSDGLVNDSLEDFPKDFPDTSMEKGRISSRICTDIQDPNRTPKMSYEPWLFTPPGFDLEAFESITPSEKTPEFYKPLVRWAETPHETMTGYSYVSELVAAMEAGQEMHHGMIGPEHTSSVGWIENTHCLAEQLTPFEQPQIFAESGFPHHTSDFKNIPVPQSGALIQDRHKLAETQPNRPPMNYPVHVEMTGTSTFNPAFIERFRFHVKLNAPTAMMERENQIPVTYLNKGQIYLLSINDTAPAARGLTPVRYRTSIRISFEDEDQKKGRSSRWQLWKNGRGAKESDQRGVQLQGVEYVEVQQAIDYQGSVELETSSIDGFSVLWSQKSSGSADCYVAIRFNFLSTDFSYAKGVRGISCRLCTKTVIVFPHSPPIAQEIPDVSYCQVKLFRDHGAERKLANDVVHVNRSINKIKQQISKIEFDVECLEKRRQRASTTENRAQSGLTKDFPGHKSPWPLSPKSSAEEGFYSRLSLLQAMLLSAHPVSILSVRGREQDDPDRQPILFVDEPENTTQATAEKTVDSRRRTNGYSTGKHSKYERPTLDQMVGSQSMPPPSTRERRLSDTKSPASPQSGYFYVEEPDEDKGRTISKLAETVEGESSSRKLKAVACFYTLHPGSISSFTSKAGSSHHENHHYQAIYLDQRTADTLATSIAAKYNFPQFARRIVRIIHVSTRMKPGIEITVDDDFVRELREGQDMILEWERFVDKGAVDEERFDEEYVLRLIF